MGPRTGPRPASSTPRQHGGREDGSEAEVGWRRMGGTGEKCVYEEPERRGSWWMEGGRKAVGDEGSSVSSMVGVLSGWWWICSEGWFSRCELAEYLYCVGNGWWEFVVLIGGFGNMVMECMELRFDYFTRES